MYMYNTLFTLPDSPAPTTVQRVPDPLAPHSSRPDRPRPVLCQTDPGPSTSSVNHARLFTRS